MKASSRWQRLREEGKFLLGAAAAGCLVGAAGSFFLPPLSWVAEPLSQPVQAVIRIAHGVGLGWWAGLFWGLFTLLLARSQPTPPPVCSLPSAGLWAAGVLLATWAAGFALDLGVRLYLPAGLLLALVVTRLAIARFPHDRG